MQAEDGIRDGHVTGVQTCALPIYLVRRNVPDTGGSPNRLHVQLPRRLEILHVGGLRASSLRIQPRGRELRSEERRVGKEWRSRGSRKNWRQEDAKSRGC